MGEKTAETPSEGERAAEDFYVETEGETPHEIGDSRREDDRLGFGDSFVFARRGAFDGDSRNRPSIPSPRVFFFLEDRINAAGVHNGFAIRHHARDARDPRPRAGGGLGRHRQRCKQRQHRLCARDQWCRHRWERQLGGCRSQPTMCVFERRAPLSPRSVNFRSPRRA